MSSNTFNSSHIELGNKPDLIDLLPMAAYAVRAPDGVIVWFNSKAVELWGREPKVGDTDERFCGAHRLYHADGTFMAHCDTPVALALKTGASVHDEVVVIEKPDGSRVTVSVHIDPIRDGGGKIVGVVNYFQDISKREQAERTKALLAAIVSSSDDAIISKNLDGIITSWNGGAERIFGYTAEEAVGRSIALIIPPDRSDEEAMILARLKRGERIEHYETRRVRNDGKCVDISLTISPLKDGFGRVIGASKVARDITGRKRAEQLLAEHSRLLDLSSDAIFVRDMADRLTYWNNAAAELYGYSREEVLGRVPHELLQSRFPEPLDLIHRTLHCENRWAGELVHTHKDGTQLVVLSRWSLARDAQGNPNCILETNNDVTQQKRNENALRENEQKLRTLTENLETEVSVRTQELERRNIEVLLQSEQLRELSNRLLHSQDDERRRIARELHDSAGQIVAALGMSLASITRGAGKNAKILKIVKESHEMVQQLTKEIRTVSYLLHPPLLDETGLSDAIRWYMKGLAERSGLNIQLDIPADFGRLPNDLEVAIFRIVQECLTNIHRHSGSKTATIRLSHNFESVFLEIQDNGTGMSEAKLAAIRSQQSGVGITGMRERVPHLQGTMDIQSNKNGTTISTTFPLSTTANLGSPIADQKISAAT